MERFSALSESIMASGMQVIVTGSDHERVLAERLLKAMRNPSISAAGELSLMGTAALCQMARYVVSNDTLLVHLASATGTPVVALYGPNTPFLYGPYPPTRHAVIYDPPPCSPCLANVNRKVSQCQEPECMNNISVDRVLHSIRSLGLKSRLKAV